MGKGFGDAGLLPTHSQQQQTSAQLQKLAFIGFLSLLLTVNLLYFVKTHSRIETLTASAGTSGNSHKTTCQLCGPQWTAPRE